MASTVSAPSAVPIRKVTAGVLAGAIVTIGVFILQQLFHVSVPSEVAGALVTIISFIVAYLVPSLAGEAPAKGATP